MSLFVDLDGVLGDFMGGACELHGRPLYAVTCYDWWHEWGMTDSDFWAPVKQVGHCFYQRYVKPYPWAVELLALVKSMGDFVVVTANPSHPGLAASKTEWIREHIGYDVPVITTCKGGNYRAADLKAMLAGPGRVLIDDSDDNVAAFRVAGGRAITLPQPWNTAHAFTHRRIEYVKDCLIGGGHYGEAV